MHSLEGKQAVILGGTSGIGLAVAQNFISTGANTLITGRRSEGEQIAEKIGAEYRRCDITHEEDVRLALSAIEETMGKIDILVINAGIAADEESIEVLDSKTMDAMIDVNLKGTFYALKVWTRCVKRWCIDHLHRLGRGFRYYPCRIGGVRGE